MLYPLQSAVLRFLGDIRWHGILHPFWFTINAKTYRIKGQATREVQSLILPGDILIRRFEGFVDKWFIPGWWNHSGIYVGNHNGRTHQVVHAMSQGVIVEDLIDFCRTDHLIVLRAPQMYQAKAVERAIEVIGREYDFAFDLSDDSRLSCTHVLYRCYPELILPKQRWRRLTVVGDDIVDSKWLTTIWDSRKAGKPKPRQQ